MKNKSIEANEKKVIDLQGYNKLHIPVAKGDIETVKKLIDEGEDVHAKNIYGDSLLYYALPGGIEMFKFLVEECKVSIHSKNEDGDSLLYYAKIENRTEIIEYLIENGAEL